MQVIQAISMQIARMALAAALVCLGAHAFAQDSQRDSGRRFGGPDAVENELEERSDFWGDWQTALKNDHGFALSFDYTAVLLSASDTVSDSTGAGGIARVFGAGDLFDEGAKLFARGRGSLPLN